MAFHHCVTQVAEGKKEHAKPLQYFADCAGFCALSACNIAKHSPLMAFSCDACGEACEATLAVVSKFDSEEMKAATKALTTLREVVQGDGRGDGPPSPLSQGRWSMADDPVMIDHCPSAKDR